MTELGQYLSMKAVNQSEVCRKTGINRTRLSELINSANSKLKANEIYLIALAIDESPCEVMDRICKDVKLADEN
jgi:predicted XRE-type DNA-binding protein